MTYYQQVKKLVLPRLKAFQNDLLVHDRKIFRKYQNKNISFIHGSRDTGTNMIILDEITIEDKKEDVMSSFNVWILGKTPYCQGLNNDYLLYGHDDIVEEISSEDAIKTVENMFEGEY